ncbi:hypothetical protein D3C85_1405890 [compost metagenome]
MISDNPLYPALMIAVLDRQPDRLGGGAELRQLAQVLRLRQHAAQYRLADWQLHAARHAQCAPAGRQQAQRFAGQLACGRGIHHPAPQAVEVARVDGVADAALANHVLGGVVYRAFLGQGEAAAHGDGVGTQCQRRNQPLAGAKTACGDDR